jgi:hypothetical protein
MLEWQSVKLESSPHNPRNSKIIVFITNDTDEAFGSARASLSLACYRLHGHPV